MTPIHAFATDAASWQNFYLLVGEAAATLTGLMFVAVSFGASLITAKATPSARAFLDPPFTHLVTVLFTACLLVIPTMTATILGAALLGVTGLRSIALVGVLRRMREAHAKFGDLELSDWVTGVVLPLACWLALGAAGAGFLRGYAMAFTGLAVVVIVVLLLGVFGAWELMMWLALTRVQAKEPQDG